MITQGFHFLFGAFVHHNVINVATCCCYTNFLECVFACVGPVFAAQCPRERWVWLVWWGFDAHHLWKFCRGSPRVGTAMGAQSFSCAPMWTRKRTKFLREFALQVRPPSWEVRVLVTMWPISNVVSLADVRRSRIRFAIRGMIAQGFHAFFWRIR